MFADFMDWIKQMIYLLVFLTLLLQILPNGNYKKYVRFFAGMIFVVTLVSPVISMVFDDEWENTIGEALESEMQDLENKTESLEGWNESNEAGSLEGWNESNETGSLEGWNDSNEVGSRNGWSDSGEVSMDFGGGESLMQSNGEEAGLDAKDFSNRKEAQEELLEDYAAKYANTL